MLVDSPNLLNDVVQYLKPFRYCITLFISQVPRTTSFRVGLVVDIFDANSADVDYLRRVFPVEHVTFDKTLTFTLWLL